MLELKGISAIFGNSLLIATGSSYVQRKFKIAVSDASPCTSPFGETVAVLHNAPHIFMAVRAVNILSVVQDIFNDA